MSKPVKELVIADYKKRFQDLTSALVVDVRGINANDNNALRLGLRGKAIRVTIVKNTLAKQAFAGTPLEPLTPVLVGPTALAYGGESVVDVARAVVEWAKKIKNLTLKGALLEGAFFEGEKGVRRLSQFPTRVEAQARVVQLFFAPAGKLIRAATSPGLIIAGIVKEIQKRLEEGQEIKKVA